MFNWDALNQHCSDLQKWKTKFVNKIIVEPNSKLGQNWGRICMHVCSSLLKNNQDIQQEKLSNWLAYVLHCYGLSLLLFQRSVQTLDLLLHDQLTVQTKLHILVSFNLNYWRWHQRTPKEWLAHLDKNLKKKMELNWEDKVTN